jgi:transcriptional regulator GlxA family with amidase domain
MSARLQAACRLLAESEIALKEVAQRCGLGTPATMRRLFMQRLGVSPAHYRDKFHVHEVLAERLLEESHTPAR